MKANRALPYLVVGVLAAFCAAGLLRAVAIVGLHVPLDPDEGWNAYLAAAAMGHGPLYPGPHSFVVNNYPPLSFYVVGIIGRWLGDAIVAGRIVSLAALAGVAAGIFAAARQMACTVQQSIFAALFYVGGMLAFTDYVGMDDPQLLAEAIALVGFLLVLRGPRNAALLAGAALLFVLAVFVKHNVIAMALAMTLWLALHERRNAFRLAGFGLGALAAGLLLFKLVYGTWLTAHLISPRSYSFALLWDGVGAWLAWGAVPLAGLVVLCLRCRRDPYVHLCAIFVAMSVLLGSVFLGGAGVDVNAMFDADIALALAAALAVNRLTEGSRSTLAAAVFAAPVLIAGSATMADTDDWLQPMHEDALTARNDIAFLALRPGPAICAMPAFCYWAHKPETVDVFNMGEAFKTGARRDAGLVRMVAARRFAVIQLDPDSPAPLGKNVRRAMERHYRLDHSDDFGDFYVPD